MCIPKCSIIFCSQEYIKYRENTLMDLLALNPFISLDMASFFNWLRHIKYENNHKDIIIDQVLFISSSKHCKDLCHIKLLKIKCLYDDLFALKITVTLYVKKPLQTDELGLGYSLDIWFITISVMDHFM